MKVRPVKRASVRAPLPTALEAAADPTLLSVAPPRASRGIGVVLGAGLLGSLLGQTSGCAKESEKPPVATLDADHAADDAKAAERAESARQSVATLVAPLLQKAMDEDGRGAFGCIAVDPPTILSENDALNLIEQEFAKAGIKLRDCYELTGFTQTRTDWKAAPEPKKVEKRGGRDESEIYFDGDGDPARRKPFPANGCSTSPRRMAPFSWSTFRRATIRNLRTMNQTHGARSQAMTFLIASRDSVRSLPRARTARPSPSPSSSTLWLEQGVLMPRQESASRAKARRSPHFPRRNGIN